MYLGRVVEAGTTEEVLDAPAAPLHAGAALGRARDRAARAGRAHRRDPRPDPDPGRLPVPPALPGPGRRHRRARPASPRPAAPSPSPCCPADRRAHRVACHLDAAHLGRRTHKSRYGDAASCQDAADSRVSRRVGGERERRELQAALPREMYVDAGQLGGRAGRGAVRRVVLRRPASTTSGWPSRSGSPSVDVAGESVLVTSDEAGALHAAYNVCRHRGSQLCPPQQAAAGAGARPPDRCAAPTTPGPTPSTARLLQGAARRASTDPGAFALHPVGVETWGGFVFVHLTPARRRATGRAGGARRGRTLANYGLGDLVTGQVLTLRRRGQLQGAARELQRVLPLRPGAPRAVPAGAVVRRRRRRPRLGRTASRTARAPGRSR